MAKNAYIGIAAVARKVKQPYFGVGGVARKVKTGYLGIGGVARQFFFSGTPMSDLGVGSTVKLKVNGVAKNFIIVHQGLPSSAYDSSCDGTWLLMEDIYTLKSWQSVTADNNYPNSELHTYLNNDFVGLLDSSISGIIKQVKVPYKYAKGANGFSAKVFPLSYTEVGFSGNSGSIVEGAVLSYFNGAINSTRIAKYNGSAKEWWLRTPDTNLSSHAWLVQTAGDTNSYNVGQFGKYGVRPALILPSTALLDGDGSIIAS